MIYCDVYDPADNDDNVMKTDDNCCDGDDADDDDDDSIVFLTNQLVFSFRCGDALHLNKQLIKSDQRAYQKELDRNYHTLLNQLEPYLRNKFGSLRGSIRKK
jgi:hypothetical protein